MCATLCAVQCSNLSIWCRSAILLGSSDYWQRLVGNGGTTFAVALQVAAAMMLANHKFRCSNVR